MFPVIIVVCSMKRIPSFILIGCYGSELDSHLHPYCNVWPGARTTSFTELLPCWFHHELYNNVFYISHHQVLF